MPLFNSGFQWRPNDNSGQTLLSYRLEAEKWYGALADTHAKSVNRSTGINFIFMVITLILNVLLLILLGILKLLITLLGGSTKRDKFVPTTRKDHSDMLERMPVREDYPTEGEYLNVLGAYISTRNKY